MEPSTLKEAVKGKLSEKELSAFRGGHDVIGDIAVIEVPEALVKKETLIAESLLKMHKNIKVVAKRVGPHKGVFRLQKLKILAGEKRKETTHSENNTRIRLNVEKVYFSPRLATERKRLADQVKRGESVLVMFSGCAPYPVVIARNSPAKEVYGVEINPTAHKCGLENIKLNKLSNVKLFLGDVRKVVPKLRKKFDRVAMPLPKGGESYLDVAIKAVKEGGTVHFYDFLCEQDIPDSAIGKIAAACMAVGKKFKIIGCVKCGQLAPRKYRVRVDFRVHSTKTKNG